jgi:hypothetical protein
MLDHHIQKAIVYHLAFADQMRFGELKPDDVDNKLFTYHLKKVIAAGLVAKTPAGSYTLTPHGKRVGKGALKKDTRMIDRAYSILLLAVRRSPGGEWLLYKRQTQPLLGLTGFMQAQPVADADASRTAHQACLEQTGLAADFRVHGHGYFRIYRQQQLESFIHFTLLLSDVAAAELPQTAAANGYFFAKRPDFAGPDMLPNMQTLHKMCEAPAGSFVEATFEA